MIPHHTLLDTFQEPHPGKLNYYVPFRNGVVRELEVESKLPRSEDGMLPLNIIL